MVGVFSEEISLSQHAVTVARAIRLREGVREELVCERLAWKASDFDFDLLRQTDESMGQSLKYRLSK